MEYIVTLGSAIEAIKKTYFANDGDYYEKSYWPLLKDRFPNCEDYWRHFVVPITKRMEANVTDQRKRTLPREHVSEDILDLASLHYSMFMHLVCGYDHVMNPRLSSFEDFYSHLAAACDLAEDFLLGAYLLALECTGGRAGVSQLAKREDSQRLAEDRYESSPWEEPDLAPTALPGRQGVLDEYFGGSDDWREYKLHSQEGSGVPGRDCAQHPDRPGHSRRRHGAGSPEGAYTGLPKVAQRLRWLLKTPTDCRVISLT